MWEIRLKHITMWLHEFDGLILHTRITTYIYTSIDHPRLMSSCTSLETRCLIVRSFLFILTWFVNLFLKTWLWNFYWKLFFECDMYRYIRGNFCVILIQIRDIVIQCLYCYFIYLWIYQLSLGYITCIVTNVLMGQSRVFKFQEIEVNNMNF